MFATSATPAFGDYGANNGARIMCGVRVNASSPSSPSLAGVDTITGLEFLRLVPSALATKAELYGAETLCMRSNEAASSSGLPSDGYPSEAAGN